MAQYEHLPIYKKAYDLTLYFDKIVRNFSRYHKYQIGAELRELSREVLRLIRRANDAEDKAPILLQNRERLEDLKMTVRCNGFGKISFFRSFFCFILDHQRFAYSLVMPAKAGIHKTIAGEDA
ncbi:MAG: hypothetical protein ILNGONEN_00561 [Syntrophorhabdaceae bacterium]|nr:hypothetical protein [Syntrophorhabdaceae bacterium]